MNRIFQPYRLISDYDTLSLEAENLLKQPAIGVDLEGDSLFHYREKVCLLQISTRDSNLLIDPLSIKDLSPLSPVFNSKKILKIFHGADYDIRSLYRDFEINVRNMFDTQIAARFLGIKETGLASLIKTGFNILLEKKYQKKDWSKRPLPDGMLSYAIQDTCYLLDLYSMLEKQLRTKGRLTWVREECILLSNVRPSPPDNSPLFLRFKGAGRMSRRDLSILEGILALRERIAETKDRPPFKVMRNEQILELVRKPPQDIKELKTLSPGQINQFGSELLKEISDAKGLIESELPIFPKNHNSPIEPIVSEKIKILKEWRKKFIETTDMDVSLICTNSQIQALASSTLLSVHELEKKGILKKWQRDLYGEEIYDLLK